MNDKMQDFNSIDYQRNKLFLSKNMIMFQNSGCVIIALRVLVNLSIMGR